MSEGNSVLCRELMDQSMWSMLSLALTHHSNDTSVCVAACRLMTTVLHSSSYDNRCICISQFYGAGMLLSLHRLLVMHETDFKLSLAIVQVFVPLLENNFTMDTLFVAQGMCDLLVQRIIYFIDHPSMKMLLMAYAGRLTVTNKFMQEKMVQLGVLIQLLGIMYQSSKGPEPTNYDCSLVQWSAWAVSCIVHKNHFTQTKFASIGGCKVILYTLQMMEDMHAVISIMRTIAMVSMHNAYLQDSLLLENAIELLQSKYLQCQSVYATGLAISNDHSSEQLSLKATYNSLVHTYQCAIEAVSGDSAADIDLIVTQTDNLQLRDLDNIVLSAHF